MVFNNARGKHEQDAPSLRKIRRSCQKELYRAAKRMKKWIPDDKMKQAEAFYLQKTVGNLQWIAENGNNRKMLCDWWEDEVCEEIARIWEVDRVQLARAFRSAFGG